MEKPLLLVVDDEPNMTEFVAFVAESLGFNAQVCTTGADFKQSFETTSPDLVVMDIAIPDIDAIELLR